MGTGPIFGYPPICYSPPNELKKQTQDRQFLSVFMKHVFQKPENLASVKDLIEARREEAIMLENL